MAGSYREEIEKLEALYAENPGGRVFTHLAEAYRKAGDLDRASEVLEAGLANHAEYSSAHVVMGRVRSDQGDPDGASAAFRRVLELDPHNMVALRALGDLCRDGHRDGEAVRFYRELLALDPSDEELAAYIDSVERVGAQESAAPPDAGPLAGAHAADPTGGEDGPFDFSNFGSVDVGADGVDATDLPLESTAEEAVGEPGTLRPDSGTPAAQDAGGFGVADLDLGDVGLDVADLGAADDVMGEPLQAGGEAAGADADADDDWAAGADVDRLAETWALEVGAASDRGLEWAAPAPEREHEAAATGPDAGRDDDAAEAPPPAEDLSAGDLAMGSPLSAEEFAPEHVGEGGADLGFGDFAASGSRDLTFDEPAASTGPPPHEHAAEGEPELLTETMADLYERQGFHDRAVEVYRELLRQRPGDPRLEAKLAEAEFKLRFESEPAQGEAAGATHASGTGSVGEPVEPAAERPVESVESAWTGAEGAVTAGDGLYAWAHEPGEPEEPADAPTIREYFDGLLGWRGTHAGAGEPGPAPAPASATEAPAPAAPAPATEAPTPAPAVEPPARPVQEEEIAAAGGTEPGPIDDADTAAGAGPGGPEAVDAADDDDLEMFRAWLQSLKQ